MFLKLVYLGLQNAGLVPLDFGIYVTQPGASNTSLLPRSLVQVGQAVIVDAGELPFGRVDINTASIDPAIFDIYISLDNVNFWKKRTAVVGDVSAGQVSGQELQAIYLSRDDALIFTVMESPVITLTTEQQAVIATFTTEQQTVIATLTSEQQAVLATSTLITAPTAEQTAIIATLSPAQQLLFVPVVVPVVAHIFVQTPEQITADKLTIEQITFKLKNNEYITDDESVLLVLNNSLMATSAMQVVDAGGGFNGLRAIGLSVSMALRVLSIFNVKMDQDKYLSEVKLTTLFANPDLLPSLNAYLAGLTPPLQLPALTPYIAHVRTDHAVYTAIKNWSGV